MKSWPVVVLFCLAALVLLTGCSTSVLIHSSSDITENRADWLTVNVMNRTDVDQDTGERLPARDCGCSVSVRLAYEFELQEERPHHGRTRSGADTSWVEYKWVHEPKFRLGPQQQTLPTLIRVKPNKAFACYPITALIECPDGSRRLYRKCLPVYDKGRDAFQGPQVRIPIYR
ncbi:MAG: hypothetical protein V1846_02935 [Candidatus Komeilibacteria bacterium]